MNKQPIEKRELRSDGSLSVHSIFQTIQGEGPFCGHPCVFIRLAGCNLQCPACDTDYTTGREQTSVKAIISTVQLARETGLVVITGGEPFRQDLRPLIYGLLEEGYFVQIETNGTLIPPVLPYNTVPEQQRGVYVVCSPKTGKLNDRLFDVACALKYVVEADNIRPEDGLPIQALQHTANPYVARPPSGWPGLIYVQPMDATFVEPESASEENRRNYAAAVASCLQHGHILQIQVHKIVGVE